MKHGLAGIVLAFLFLCVPARSADWPPIPPEAWAIKATGAPGEKGAVILERRIRYGVKDTEVTERIRIFSEDGLGAVAMPSFGRAWTLEGRTVLPDDTVTPFNSSKDLVEGSIKVGHWSLRGKTLVPPGLTADCVVDLHYDLDSYLNTSWVELPILRAYPVKKCVMEMATSSPLGSTLLVPKDLRAWPVPKGSYQEYTFHDLPAEAQEPYTVPGLWRPRFIFFFQPQLLRDAASKGDDAYWRAVVDRIFKSVYTDDLSFGRHYREWSKTLRAGLQGSPVAQATELYLRLQEKILNISHLTGPELAALSRKEADERFQARDLDASVERGRTSALGLHYLFFQLLVDQGLEPKLLLAANRRDRVFMYGFHTLQQFTATLIGVGDGAGKFVWFEPQRRFYPAGLLDPGFQEAEGLWVEPKDWSFKVFKAEPQVAAENRSHYAFELRFGETETFAMKADFTGYAEHQARADFSFLDPAEWDRTLKERVEKQARDLTLARVSVENAADLRKPFGLTAEGTTSFEGGRRRSFPPFPGLACPLEVPETWPASRTLPIVLPYRQTFTAVSRFQVPEGWVLAQEKETEEANFFGSVSWRMKALPDRWAEVTWVVTVDHVLANTEGYRSFKAYLGWVEAAFRRTLTLERP